MSRRVHFFTKNFQSGRRYARSTSGLFSLAPRLYGKSLGPHRIDSERRHLLPTQHGQQRQDGCHGALPARGVRDDMQNSLVDAFATFLLLSFVKISNVSLDLLTAVEGK